MWNFNETSFRISVGGQQIVVTYGARLKGDLIVSLETNRDYLTLVEAISARGVVILLMLILKARVHLY
jgi:hypothetical protein